MSRLVWGPEWIRLPSGSHLHRDDLGQGCSKCGETVFNIYGSGEGVACPHCVKKRVKSEDGSWRECTVYGKFDMVAMRVVKVFKRANREGEP